MSEKSSEVKSPWRSRRERMVREWEAAGRIWEVKKVVSHWKGKEGGEGSSATNDASER